MATYTSAQIAALAEKIASGELSVRYGDKTVTYHSLAEMRALLAEMQSDVAGSTGDSRSSLAAFYRE